MPEVFRSTPFTQELAIRQHNEMAHTVINDKDVSALEQDSATLFPDMDFLGIGSESIVVGYHDRPDKAIGYFYEDSRFYIDRSHLAKYYMHRALSILYPQHFPRFYAVAIGEHGGSVRERVNTKPITTKRWYETRKKWHLRTWQAYSDIYDEFSDLGNIVKYKIKLDRNDDNFGLVRKHPVYLDFIPSDTEDFNIDIVSAISYIHKRQRARVADPHNATPIADGIVNEERTFLESMRRVREFALVDKYSQSKTVPNRKDIENALIDIGVHMGFKTLEERKRYYEASYARICQELSRRNKV